MDDWKTPHVVDIAGPIVMWLRQTLELDPAGRVSKNDVYQLYCDYCYSRGITPKRNSDFGKVIRKAFPDVSSRRLGSAGKQVSHYSGICIRGSKPPSSQPVSPNSTGSPSGQQGSPGTVHSLPQPAAVVDDRMSYESPRNGGAAVRKRRMEEEDGATQSPSPPSARTRHPSAPSSPKKKGKIDPDPHRQGGTAAATGGSASPKRQHPHHANSNNDNNHTPAGGFVQLYTQKLPHNPPEHPCLKLIDPHSSTDDFFAKSISARAAASATSPHLPHPARNSLSPPPLVPSPVQIPKNPNSPGHADDYTEGNDQSPNTRGKRKRPEELLPLIPSYPPHSSKMCSHRGDAGSEKGHVDEGDQRHFSEGNDSFCYSPGGSPQSGGAFYHPSATAQASSPTCQSLYHLQSEGAPASSRPSSKFSQQTAFDTFQYVVWPLVPLHASLLREESVDWFLSGGKNKKTSTSLLMHLALYYASVCAEDLLQASQEWDILMEMIPAFYNLRDVDIMLALIMLSSNTFSWYPYEQALSVSRHFLATAMRMCGFFEAQQLEVYHLCLDVRAFIEKGHLTPSLHARFPLHDNDYPASVVPTRVSIKQCQHLVTMVKHIVYILENAPPGTKLPISARADIEDKLELLSACYKNMTGQAMQAHPFLANYIRQLLVGATADLRWALGEKQKAVAQATLFVEFCKGFPFPDVVCYASRVVDILLLSDLVDHAKALLAGLSKYSTHDVQALLKQHQTLLPQNSIPNGSSKEMSSDATEAYLQ